MEIPCKSPGVEYIELSTYVVTGFVVIVSNTKSARTIIPINVLLLKGGGEMQFHILEEIQYYGVCSVAFDSIIVRVVDFSRCHVRPRVAEVEYAKS